MDAADWYNVAWTLSSNNYDWLNTLLGAHAIAFPGKPAFVTASTETSRTDNKSFDPVLAIEDLYSNIHQRIPLGGIIANVSPEAISRLDGLASKINADNIVAQTSITDSQKATQTNAEKVQETVESITELVTHHSVANDQLPVVDQLHYDDYARALAEVLVSEETTTPLTVGIYGAWGMGKSFLMRRVKEMVADWPKDAREFRANAQKPKHEYHFVEFNAWVYSGSENLWAGMITTLYDEIEKFVGPQRAFWFRLGRNFWKSLRKTAWLGIICFILSLLVVTVFEFDTWFPQYQALQPAVTGLAGLAGISFIAALPPLITAIRDLSTNVVLKRSEQLAALSSRRDFKDKIGFMADIKSEITEIRELLEDRRQKDKSLRVVIMIDDLDRCPPAKAVEVLEAIMLLLADKDGAPFIVLLGIDARIIVKAIEERYNKVLTEAGITGYEYLDKIVQIPFRIPEPDEDNRKAYVASLLTPVLDKRPTTTTTQPPTSTLTLPLPSEDTQPQPATPTPSGEPGQTQPQQQQPIPGTPDNPVVVKKSIEVSATKGEVAAFGNFAKYLSPNPRRMKRIVNVYRVARLLPRSLTEDQRRKLIKWVILSEQWPLRVSWILEEIENDQQQFPEAIQAKLDNTNNDQPSVGRRYNEACTLGEVFETIQERFDKTGRAATLDGDPELFEQFIKQEPLISVADNKWLWPLSFNLNPAIKQEIWKARIGSKQADK